VNKTKEVARCWGKLHVWTLRYNRLRVGETRRIDGQVRYKTDEKDLHDFLPKASIEQTIWNPRAYIQIYLKEMEWIQLVQSRDHRRPLVETVMNLRVPYMGE
jgi:hypothetical protein